MEPEINGLPIALKELLERAANNTSEGITISDMHAPDRPLVFLNHGFETMTGYSREESVGRNCRFLQGPGTDPKSVAQLREAIKANQPCTVELLNYRKDGRPFWNRLSITPIKNEQGETTHYVGIQSDVTELRQTRERLERANAELQLFRDRITSELEQARMAQIFILPVLPSSDSVQFASKFVPMAEVGGDFYDIVELEEGVFGILIADVTGHGIPAALLTFMTSTTFKNVAPLYRSTAETLADTNTRLHGRMPDDAFVTMFYAIYDAGHRRLTFTQAGHPEALLLRRSAGEVVPLGTNNPLVGILDPEEVSYTEHMLTLEPGDMLLMYTDALVEALDESSDNNGLGLLCEYLLNNLSKSGQRIIDGVYEYGLKHAGIEKYPDDFTLLGMEVTA